MARRVTVPGDLQQSVDAHLKDAMTPDEAAAALDLILRSGLPQVIVSRYSLPDLYTHSRTLTMANVLKEIEQNRRVPKAYRMPPHLGPYVAPRTENEIKITAMWEELLGVGPVGTQHNFLELGGHSLLATRVISRIHEKMNIRVSLNKFLATPTIAGLAALVDAALPTDAPSLIPRANPAHAGFRNLIDEIGHIFDEDIDPGHSVDLKNG
jgi:acyl carrier protein